MKRILQLLILIMLVGMGLLAWTFTGAKLTVGPMITGSMPSAAPPPGMTLSALPTGEMRSRAAFAFRGGSFADEREFAMTTILVRHPKGDLMFDTGFGLNVDAHVETLSVAMKATATYRKGIPAGVQLSANGDDLRQLAGVVLTHAHWDHVSGLDSLPGVPVWVNVAERAFIESDSSMTALARRLGPLNYRSYIFDSGPYLGFAQSHDVWGDGAIVLVSAAGHTPGSILAFITLPSGQRYLLLGDLVWQKEGIALPAERPWVSRQLVDSDAKQVRENIARVAEIHRRFPQIRLLPAHDKSAMSALPVFPATAR